VDLLETTIYDQAALLFGVHVHQKASLYLVRVGSYLVRVGVLKIPSILLFQRIY